MCKDTSPKRLHHIFNLIGFILFGVFCLLGGAFYLDYLTHQRFNCGDKDSTFNKTTTPDCYSHHFFGVGWLTMAAGVPIFAIWSEYKKKCAIYGVVPAFIAGVFGLYFVIMVFVDDEPFNFQKD